jgi:hypothetical protein
MIHSTTLCLSQREDVQYACVCGVVCVCMYSMCVCVCVCVYVYACPTTHQVTEPYKTRHKKHRQ